MHATLSEFLRMPPEMQKRVTSLDLTLDGDAKPWRSAERRGDAEEWPGEAVATGLKPEAGGGE